MSKNKAETKKTNVNVHIIKSTVPSVQPIKKAEQSTQISKDRCNYSEWIELPADLRGYKSLVNGSSILPQCIRAYKNNIVGFGIGVRYTCEDDKENSGDHNREHLAEFERVTGIIDTLNMDMDTKEIFEDLIEARETYGIAYLEVIRALSVQVSTIEFIREVPSIRKTVPLDPYIEITHKTKNGQIKRHKRFCKYRQTIGGKEVFFKEIGDPRIMDKRTGEYVVSLELQYQANEILEFAIGTEPYGEVRWTGQILGVDGSRKAETLNNTYFTQGRHTPMLIMVKGGTLSEDSFNKMQEYMNGIKGEAGQHAFMVLEAEPTGNATELDQDIRPEVEIKNLAGILQRDELFQDYLDNNRKKVQSAFQLPDLYVGYTTDFNRATAQTAQEITEKQVFQPERKSLAWVINNKLLCDYDLKYTECYFKEPDITNPDDLYKILTVCNNAGGLTPNKAKDILYNTLGQISTDYEEDWGNTPVIFYNKENGINNSMLDQLTSQIKKAQENSTDNEVVAVMKEVKRMILKMQEADQNG